jgi:hypothetical protein
MKCSGPVPPCDRCRKAKSYCHFESPSAQQQQQQQAQQSAAAHQPRQPLMTYPNGYLEQQSFIALPPAVMSVHQDISPPSDAHRQEPSPQTTTVASALTFGAAGSTASRVDDAALLERPPLSPPENSECPAGKRRRTRCPASESTDTADDGWLPEGSAAGGHGSPVTASSSPYEVVQDFEANHRRAPVHVDPGPFGSDLSSSFPETAAPGGAILTRDLHGKQALAKHLAAVDLSFADARDMFALFGDRVAPFIPWLYDQDFTRLPNDPLFALACLRAITRYLPGVDSLWRKLEGAISTLLQQVIFDDLGRPYEAVLETFKGLGIVYGYSEVGVVGPIGDILRPKFDTLSVKGIIEGYAVRWNIGKPHPSNATGCLLWLWLYTMSTQ